jgi:hypothetical protein
VFDSLIGKGGVFFVDRKFGRPSGNAGILTGFCLSFVSSFRLPAYTCNRLAGMYKPILKKTLS